MFSNLPAKLRYEAQFLTLNLSAAENPPPSTADPANLYPDATDTVNRVQINAPGGVAPTNKDAGDLTVIGEIALEDLASELPPLGPTPSVPTRNTKRNTRQTALHPIRSSARLQNSRARQTGQVDGGGGGNTKKDADLVEPKADGEDESISRSAGKGKGKRGPNGPAVEKETHKRFKITRTPTPIATEPEVKTQRQQIEGPPCVIGSQHAWIMTKPDGRIILRLMPNENFKSKSGEGGEAEGPPCVIGSQHARIVTKPDGRINEIKSLNSGEGGEAVALNIGVEMEIELAEDKPQVLSPAKETRQSREEKENAPAIEVGDNVTQGQGPNL